MMEQISMFNDPVEEKALRILKRVIHTLDYEFRGNYGGSSSDFHFVFNPSDKTFYYSDKSFSLYKPEAWVRRKTRSEILQMFMED